MSLRAFMFATDALRLEEGVGFHVETNGAAVAPQPSPADVRAQNEQAMKNLMGIMGGVQGAPGSKRGRRR